ncbi:MAG TPA: VacJ family lipoprotein [Opitutaceae bacterium]|nr:VacJ family lipoprotein [Opitutaceae bacterium]
MRRRILGGALGALAALLLGGCASVPSDPAARAEFRANHDPLEPMNRQVFKFNFFLDRILIKPVAKGYVRAVPPKGRTALRHFLDNLTEPIVMGNDLLQGRVGAAGTSAVRFLLNSTIGLGGFRDVAADSSLPRQTGDFGQTLWRWGWRDGGPYLVIPVLGPTNPRDGIGIGIDTYLDPVRYVAREKADGNIILAGRSALDGIDRRAEALDALDVIQRQSVDFYAAFRSYFRQNRAAELNGGKAAPSQLPPPSFYDDPGAAK